MVGGGDKIDPLEERPYLSSGDILSFCTPTMHYIVLAENRRERAADRDRGRERKLEGNMTMN